MNPVGTLSAPDEEAERPVGELDHLRAAQAQAQEDSYWSENHATRPYVSAGEAFESYAPAYAYGAVWQQANPQRQFDESDEDLAAGWNRARGNSPLDWPKAKPAVREAWYRVSDLAARATSERSEALSKSPEGPTPGDH